MHWPEELGRHALQVVIKALKRWTRNWSAAPLPVADLLRRGAVVLLGLVAAACLIATEFSTISTTGVLGTECGDLAGSALADGCDTTGAERHAYLLVVLGLIAGAMAWGAGRRASRPAAWVLTALGVIVAAIALIIDLPTLGETGTMGQLFDDVETSTGIGFWLELAGAASALAAGVLGLIRRRAAPAPVALTAATLEPLPVAPGRSADATPTHVG